MPRRCVLSLDPFAFRQFGNSSYSGTRILDHGKADFLQKVNEIVLAQQCPLVEGYAPFCKHIFLKNFTSAIPGAVEMNPLNSHLVRSGYEARRPEELPVLCRWICRDDLEKAIGEIPPAKYLDLILYSVEQIQKESEALKSSTQETPIMPQLDLLPPADPPIYSIISVKAQDVPFELPMQPITVMRNCLIDEGGSGVPIDREKYQASVAYWQNHCELR